MDALKRAIGMRKLLDFILPPRCCVCDVSTTGAPIPWVCGVCWRGYRILSRRFAINVASHSPPRQKELQARYTDVGLVFRIRQDLPEHVRWGCITASCDRSSIP